jgi:hypothetical protein
MCQKTNPKTKTIQDTPNLRQLCSKLLKNAPQTIENQAKVKEC